MVVSNEVLSILLKSYWNEQPADVEVILQYAFNSSKVLLEHWIKDGVKHSIEEIFQFF